MTINYTQGNLLCSSSEAIVNTVNCIGIMGRGIALQFKKAFPDNFIAYEKACKQQNITPGKMFVHETGSIINPKYIINFPTKRHWRDASRLEDIEAGLADLVKVIRENKIQSVSIPPLGCGLGGLNWDVVKEKMFTALSPLTAVEIDIFEPGNAPDAQLMVRSQKVPRMTSGRAALVGLIVDYLDGLLDPFITLLEVHKLMYFLQMAGEPLRLRYTKALYGPYAENLRHVLNSIEGYLLLGYADGGDDPVKQLELMPSAREKAATFLSNHPETSAHMKRVEDLVDGFETPLGLELLSTVYWVAAEGAKSLDEVAEQVYAWNDRKKQFTKDQIQITLERLIEQDWVAPISGLQIRY
jgi:O-acetyl-ADP-ribose deacetylase (regulator of RNase III)